MYETKSQHVSSTVLFLLRHFNKSPSFLHPPLDSFRKLIQHLQRRHSNTSILTSSQRLTQKILKLDEVALSALAPRSCHVNK